MNLLGLLGSIPHTLIIRAAVYGLVFTLGLNVGNHWATKRALIAREQLGADLMRENHNQLIGYYAGRMKDLRLAREQERKADQVAHEVYQQAIRASAGALRDAGKTVATLRGTVDGLRNVNQVLAASGPPDPGCVLSGELRVSINAAIDSINNRPNAGPPQTPPAELVTRAHSDAEPIACADLTRALVETLEHDAMLTAWILSWQTWATEALK